MDDRLNITVHTTDFQKTPRHRTCDSTEDEYETCADIRSQQFFDDQTEIKSKAVWIYATCFCVPIHKCVAAQRGGRMEESRGEDTKHAQKISCLDACCHNTTMKRTDAITKITPHEAWVNVYRKTVRREIRTDKNQTSETCSQWDRQLNGSLTATLWGE